MWLQDKINLGDNVICEDDPRHVGKVCLIEFNQTNVGDGRSNPTYKVRWQDTGWVSFLTADDRPKRV